MSAGPGGAAPSGGSGPLIDGQDQADGPAGAVKGKVVLRCTVGADRSLSRCVVASETPPGRGLGEAALRMSRQIRIRPETFEPEMVGQSIEIPIPFERDAGEDGDMPDGVAAMPSP